MNMHEIIVKYLSGNASESERAEVETWRTKGENEQTFNEIKQTWELSGKAEERFSPDAEMAWKKFAVLRDQKKARPRKVYYSLAAAAALIPFVLFVILSKENNPVKPVNHITASLPESIVVEEITSQDSMSVFYLPDSSRVWLNRNSVLVYPEKFMASIREVRLTGEAFFEVKRMENLPFIIYTQGAVTRVLGTSFNLKAYDTSGVEVTVVSGSVEVTPTKSKSKKLVLTANDRALVDKNNATVVKTKSVHSSKKEVWWKPKKQNRFKKFLNKIKRVFKRDKS